MLRAQSVHRENFNPTAVQISNTAFHQDRRLPGGLRLLSAERALRHRRARYYRDGKDLAELRDEMQILVARYPGCRISLLSLLSLDVIR